MSQESDGFAESIDHRLQRDSMIRDVQHRSQPWDLIVIGGGATGVGIAMDAATRGIHCLLLEQSDFGKGTSSRSTKLVHGGVRYLRQGNITLVRDALRERTLLRNNAPHLVHDLKFLIPCRTSWERFFYGTGLKLYDFLAASNNYGKSHGISASDVTNQFQTLRSDRQRGGVIYHDGQFDDSRLLINMARTAADHGATLLNYAPVRKFLKTKEGQVCGVEFTDEESGHALHAEARVVVNATGPFCDAIRRMDEAECEPLVTASQGVHLVLPRSFFPSSTAMIVPETSDGRVLFIIPWHDKALVGTTDTPISTAELEPAAQSQEVRFLLDTLADYLTNVPTIDDVTSVFTGIRPLVRGDKSAKTASLSRDHFIKTSASGLLTITGGKWTTVRKMSEDCVNKVLQHAGLRARQCRTHSLPIHGYVEPSILAALAEQPRGYYGSDLAWIQSLEAAHSDLNRKLHPELELRESDVVWGVRHEMVRTVDDMLARRSRSLFLNATATQAIAPRVAEIMARELRKDVAWQQAQVASFKNIAVHYVPASYA